MLKIRYFFWKNSKKLKNYGGLSLMLILLLGYSLYSYVAYVRTASVRTDAAISIQNQNMETEPLEGLADGKVIEQSFVGDSKGISVIKIQCATYNRKNSGTLNIELIDASTGESIEKWEKKESKLKDNEYLKLKLENEIVNSDNVRYIIRIYSTGHAKDDKLALCKSNEDSYIAGECKVDGEVQEGDINFIINPASVDNTFVKLLFAMICVAMLVLCVMVWYCIINKTNYTVEKVFVLFMTVMGIVYMIVLPAYSAPDEPIHFATAYRISNRILNVEDGDPYPMCRNSDSTMIYLSNWPSLESYRYFFYEWNAQNKNTENNSVFILGTPIDTPYVTHLPQAIGITIARCLKMSHAGLLYMGRLCTLLFYIICVYFAIKIIPIGKNVLFAISALPMLLNLASSYGYDAIVCGMAFLMIAYILNLIYPKECIEWKDYVLTIILSIVFSPCKLVYCLIAFMVILIPKKKFASKRQNYMFKMIVPLTALGSAVIYNMGTISSASGGTNIIVWANEEGYTITYLLEHILLTIRIYVATFHENFSLYADSLIGGALGWGDVDIPSDLTMASLIILVISLKEAHSCNMKFRHKIVYFCTFFCVSMLVGMTMLLSWTPKSYTVIAGIQGRYFLPVLPLLMLCFVDGTRVRNQVYTQVVMMGSCVINYLVVLRIFEIVVMR